MDFWFVFKKIVSVGLTPLGITLELTFIGLILVNYSRRISAAKPGPKLLWFKGFSGDMGTILIGFAVLFIYLCSIETVAHGLSYTLEQRHPVLEKVETNPDFIVVLPGGARKGKFDPPNSGIERRTFVRLMKGVEYWKQFPEATVVFTGTPKEVNSMKAIAVKSGVPPQQITLENKSRDTKDHAVYLRQLLAGKTFLLVTSGNHMPRSVGLFRGQGLNPIAAPTDFHAGEVFPLRPRKFIPRMHNLQITDEAFHEYLGMGWAKIRRQIESRDEALQDAAVAGNVL